MKSQARILPNLSAAFASLALLTVATGAAWAADPSTTAYLFSSHPMISGTVVTVNDHQMVVNTDQGEQVALEVDSRTMAPRDLAPGMVMRAEFRALEDCRFYAQRILAIRDGTSTNRMQAYANTRDSRAVIAENAAGLGEPNLAHAGATRSDSRVTEPQTMHEHSPGRSMTATRATADYDFSTNPMLAGTVVAVNDHRLVVRTRQGQRIAMVMDSGTMLPREVGPGTEVRTEFSRMDDGRYYAKRIRLVGSSVAEREQAYAHTQDSDLVIASQAPDCGFVNVAGSGERTSAIGSREPGRADAAMPSIATPAVATPETLPQTASARPWLLLLGFGSLGCAVLVTVIMGVRG